MVFYNFFKRCLDIAISLSTILILSSVFVVLIIAIRLSRKGPKNVKSFTLCKLRTMKIDIDPFGAWPKSGEDSRLTGIGKFMHEHSLDELPRLFNVLKGNS